MITYERILNGDVIVKLEGKRVGWIHQVPGGFQYRPSGDHDGGEIFRTLSDCKRSLEVDEDSAAV